MVQFPAGVRDCSLLHSVQTGSGAHPASYSVGTMGSFPDSEATGVWSWTPPYAELKNGSVLPPLPHTSSWHGAKLIKHRIAFTFTFIKRRF
jgi:hypothetical protein